MTLLIGTMLPTDPGMFKDSIGSYILVSYVSGVLYLYISTNSLSSGLYSITGYIS